jgi:hypothetical protein
VLKSHKSQSPKSNSRQDEAATVNPSRSVDKGGTGVGTKWLALKQAPFACNLEAPRKTQDQQGYRPMEVSEGGSSSETPDQHAYLAEYGKAGKLSDTDSGIASPLSPSSLYGFLGYVDKNKEGCSQIISQEERLKLLCLRETVKVSS